jgi:hypothetical protein
MTLLARVLATLGSVGSASFGIWHFFVPRAWNWYSYIAADATELILAVRATNVFFSLSLVLFGAVNLLLIYGKNTGRYAVLVALSASCVLWITRTVLQLVYPQGTLNPALQYGMLAAFIFITLCFVLAFLILACLKKTP